jgi:hypothetical protein
MTKCILTILFAICANISAFGSTNFDYPELMVSPSATNRLLMMAKKESSKKFFQPLAMQISATSTLVASFLTAGNMKELGTGEENNANTIGLIVGGGWLVFNYFQFNKKRYYSGAFNSVKKMPSKTKEQKLAKERIAEEALRDRAKTVKRFTWISAVTNLAAGILMADETKANTTALNINYLAAGISLLPFIFESEEVTAYETHKSYKKKIYAPLVQTKLFYDKGTKKYAPGVNVSYSF